jgi:hypothetical protein
MLQSLIPAIIFCICFNHASYKQACAHWIEIQLNFLKLFRIL